MTDLTGQTINQYQIIEEIGRGGMATVYRAYQPGMDREVALKILPAQFSQDATFLARFEREAHIAAQVQHPRILPIYDVGEYEGMPYIVMAYMPGGTLEDMIQQYAPEGLPLDTTLHYANQIAEGLDALHASGIVHRDLKPSNILIDEHGDLYLGDFGIATVQDVTSHLTGTGMVGTPRYMAPEVFRDSETSTASDIYAFGLIIYEMLTGRSPFEADTPAQWMRAHLEKPVPPVTHLRSDLPDTVNFIFETALATLPGARYGSAGGVNDALRRVIPVAVTQIQSYPRPTRFRWWWAVAGLGLLVLVTGGLVVLLVSRDTASNLNPTEDIPLPAVTDPPVEQPQQTPTTNPPTESPTLIPEVTDSIQVPVMGGGSGILGFNSRGLGFTLNVGCAIEGTCDPATRILPQIGNITPYFGRWSPDATYLAFSLSGLPEGEDRDLDPIYLRAASAVRVISSGEAAGTYIVNLRDQALTRYDGRVLFDPAWLPDGHGVISFGQWYPYDCVTVSGDRGCNLHAEGGYQMVWSPDGSKLAYLSDGTIHLADADRQNDSVLMAFPRGQWLGWLSDNRTLLAVSNVPTENFIGIQQFEAIDTETGRSVIVMTNEENGFQYINLSPDRRYLVFVFERILDGPDRDSSKELYLLDLACIEDGFKGCQGKIIQVTNNTLADVAPSWSPDSSTVAFVRGRYVWAIIYEWFDFYQEYREHWITIDMEDGDVFLMDVQEALQGAGEDSIIQITHFGNVDYTPPQWQPALGDTP